MINDVFKQKVQYCRNVFLIIALFIIVFVNIDIKGIWIGLDYFLNTIQIRNIAYAIIIIEFIIKLINREFTCKELATIAVVLPFIIYVTSQTIDEEYFTNMDPLLYFALIITYKDFDYKQLIKVVLVSYCCSCLILLIKTLYKILPIVMQYENGFERVRYSIKFGQGAAASFSYCWMYIVYYYVYVRNFNIRNTEISLLFVVTLFIYYLSRTRTALGICIVILLISFLLKNCSSLRKYTIFHKTILIIAPVLLPLLTLLVTYGYNDNSELYVLLNKVFSGRLGLFYNGLLEFGITLYPKRLSMSMVAEQFNVVDSSYLYILLKFGLLFYIVFTITLLFFSHQINKKRDIFLFYITILFYLSMCINSDLCHVIYNYFLFIWSYKKTYVIN